MITRIEELSAVFYFLYILTRPKKWEEGNTPQSRPALTGAFPQLFKIIYSIQISSSLLEGSALLKLEHRERNNLLTAYALQLSKASDQR